VSLIKYITRRLVRLADSAGFRQPQQYFSLTQNQPSHQPTSQPTVLSSHTKSASQPAEQGVKSRTLNLLSDAHEAADADFFALLVLVDGVGIWKTRRDKPVDPLATSAPAAAHARRTGRRRDGV